jgi:hypothetical protein
MPQLPAIDARSIRCPSNVLHPARIGLEAGKVQHPRGVQSANERDHARDIGHAGSFHADVDVDEHRELPAVATESRLEREDVRRIVDDGHEPLALADEIAQHVATEMPMAPAAICRRAISMLL